MIWPFIFACTTTEEYNAMLDGPGHVSIFDSSENSIFEAPVGFITNTRSGRITPIDLLHLGPLSDQKAAPFLRSRGVATGAKRQIQKAIPYQNNAGHIKLFTVDKHTQQALSIPYIISEDLDVYHPQASDIVFFDSDSSGDTSELSALTLIDGHTTTEDWELEYNGEQWTVQGSRSGHHPNAVFDQAYVSTDSEVSFRIQGNATKGDTISFSTDSGILEAPLNAVPLDLQKEGETILIALYDEEAKQGFISLYSLESDSETQRFPLPDGMQPWRISRSFENHFYISDARNPRIIQFALDGSYVEITTPSIVQELLIVESETYSHLFLGSATQARLDLYDLETQTWIDINQHDQTMLGLPLSAPVSGMSSNAVEIELQTYSNNGVNNRDHVFMLSTLNGLTHMVEASSGCLATTAGGASLEDSSAIGVSSVLFFDNGTASDPSFFLDEYTGNMVSTSRCGGVVKEEDWTVTYDQIDGNWIVEGTLSGIQNQRAYLNQRYISDKGDISFSIVEGALSPSDGDQFSFETIANILTLNSITNSQGNLEPLELPGNSELFGVENMIYAAVPFHNTDIVVRLHLEDWVVDGLWN